MAPYFRDNRDHVVYSDVDFRLNVNFKEAFGTREVQYWKYKERKGQIRYDNTPSIFDAYRAHVAKVFYSYLADDVFMVVRE